MDEPGREDFEKFLLECFPPSGKRGTSGIFYQEFGEKVKEAIKVVLGSGRMRLQSVSKYDII